MNPAQEKLERNALLRRDGGLLRDFHAMRWDEPLIMEMGRPGERGVIPPQATDVAEDVAAAEDLLPPALVRRSPPALPWRWRCSSVRPIFCCCRRWSCYSA